MVRFIREASIVVVAALLFVPQARANPACGRTLHVGTSTFQIGPEPNPGSPNCGSSTFQYPLLGSPSGLARIPGAGAGPVPLFVEGFNFMEIWLAEAGTPFGVHTVVFDTTFASLIQSTECEDASEPGLFQPYIEETNNASVMPVFGGSGVLTVYTLWGHEATDYGPIGSITARSTDVDADGDTDEADELLMRNGIGGSNLNLDLDWSGAVADADLQILLQEARRRDANGNPFGRKHCVMGTAGTAGSHLPGGYDPAVNYSFIPPSSPTSFSASAVCGQWKLSWVNGGEDGTTGTAYRVEVRYFPSGEIDTEDAWRSAQPLVSTTPTAVGTSQSFMTSLAPSISPKYFALRMYDDNENASVIAHGHFAVTETTVPATTTGMTAVRLNGGGAGGQARIRWTSAGDDANTGTPTSYDLRWSDAPITSANFAGATQILPSPAPVAAGTLVTAFFPMDACTQYYFALKTIDDQGTCSGVSNSPTVFSSCTSGLTAELEGSPELPARLDLSVRSSDAEGVAFELSIPATLNGSNAKLEIMDVLGRKVATIVSGMQPAGRRTVAWGLNSNSGGRVPIGVYAARLRVGDTSRTAKFTVLR
ncbi:MAG: hypothetical protein ABL977_15780 [Candidatus Eisenbacteria bacterium]